MKLLLAFTIILTLVSCSLSLVLPNGEASTKIRHTECGGIVRVSSTENPIIEYKTDRQNYTSNEACVWSIVPGMNESIYSYLVYFDRQDFSDRDGLVWYSWSAHAGLNATKLYSSFTRQTILFQTRHAFLYFSSDGSSETGTGFRISIVGINGGSRIEHDPFHFQGQGQISDHSFIYPPFPQSGYKNFVTASIVIQPQSLLNETSFQIDSLFTKEEDILDVFALPSYYENVENHYILEGSYSGSNVSSIMTRSNMPRLLLFNPNNDGETDRGFQISWTN